MTYFSDIVSSLTKCTARENPPTAPIETTKPFSIKYVIHFFCKKKQIKS